MSALLMRALPMGRALSHLEPWGVRLGDRRAKESSSSAAACWLLSSWESSLERNDCTLDTLPRGLSRFAFSRSFTELRRS